jgi:hypothetical protein
LRFSATSTAAVSAGAILIQDYFHFAFEFSRRKFPFQFQSSAPPLLNLLLAITSAGSTLAMTMPTQTSLKPVVKL